MIAAAGKASTLAHTQTECMKMWTLIAAKLAAMVVSAILLATLQLLTQSHQQYHDFESSKFGPAIDVYRCEAS